MPRPYILLAFALILLAPILPGCGGGGDNPVSDPPATISLDGVTPSTTTPTSLDRVGLLGLPAAARGHIDLKVVILGLDERVSIPVEEDDNGHFFHAPFHPATPEAGGTVSLQVVSGAARSPEFSFELGALADAPGSFGDLVDELVLHIDGHAQRLGSSLDALKALSFEATPDALFQLKYAQSFVDDPTNPNSLTLIADGTSTLLTAAELQLLDQVSAYTAFDALVALEVASLDDLDPPVARGLVSGGSAQRRACIDVKLKIGTAAALSAAMWEAKFADIAISGDAGNTLTALSATLAAGAVIPGAGLAFTAAGAGVAAWQASRGALAGMNPSSFASIEASIDKSRFDEDAVDPGHYSNVMVTAVSKGWSADQAMVDAVTTALGAPGSAAQKGAITASGMLGDAATATINQGMSNYVGQRENGAIEFCPQTWTVDISLPLWCEAKAPGGKLNVATGAQTYWPAAAGPEILRVSNIRSQFGQEYISVDKAVEVEAIIVTASPTRIPVRKPGEEVQITVTLKNAEVMSLFWDAPGGEWKDGMGGFTNEPGTRPLRTPPGRDDYPFLVTIESFSRQGIRESGTPKRQAFVTVTLDEDIVVSPPNPCLQNNEREQFTATQGDEPADVIWSLETPEGGPSSLGSLSSTGFYTAPGSGSGRAVVVATSSTNENLRGVTGIEVGACECYWSLAIESEGEFSGTFASHAFPSFGGFFSFSFGDTDKSLTGNLQAFTDPIMENQTGVFEPEGFAFATLNRAWSATSDPEDETPFTMTITKNNTTNLEGSVDGVCVTAIDGKAVYRNFNLVFRSGNLADGSICGEQ
ncbi:hypothetical protein DRQ32_03770 [bacterium]|nr:MAG: hypothetical protein DRQ32_03770 [bacterium]